MRMRFLVLAAAWLSFLLVLPAAAAPSFPALTGRVVDDAGVLSEQARDELTTAFGQEEQRSGNQVVVVTLKSLQGYSIDDYGYQLGRYWKLGQKEKSNGILIEIAPNEHQARIDVGYGLEGELTDAQSKLIIAEIMAPDFKRGDYDAGVLAGTSAVLQALGGKPITPAQGSAEQESRGESGNPIGQGIIPILVLVVLFWIFGARVLLPLFFLGVLGGGWGGRGGRGGWGGGGWGGGGFGGGGFGGGGFSGGGGSFGGGGASGSW
jgi:uncharacterized protein